MNCTVCGHSETRVIDSRESRDSVRRRRECVFCQGRFTTYERAYNSRLQVEKRNGRREDFSEEKLAHSLELACAKRTIPIGSVDEIVEDIRQAILENGRECIESSLIGEMSLQRLRELDHVAYLRYASVYRNFDEPQSFAEEADKLQSEETLDDLLQGRLLGADALYAMDRRVRRGR